MVYLPTFTYTKSTIHVGTYTVRPMDGMVYVLPKTGDPSSLQFFAAQFWEGGPRRPLHQTIGIQGPKPVEVGSWYPFILGWNYPSQ